MLEFLINGLCRDQILHFIHSLLSKVEDVKLEALVFWELLAFGWILRRVLQLSWEQLYALERGEKLLLLLHLVLAHDLADGDLQRSQTADMSDVQVQETLEGKSLTDVSTV